MIRWCCHWPSLYTLLPLSRVLNGFCIKDPDKQIIRWVMVIEKEYDPKVEKLGLHTEFDSTECICV